MLEPLARLLICAVIEPPRVCGQLTDGNTVFEEVTGGTDEIELGTATVASRAYVSWFGFKSGDQQKRVSALSGGERNRTPHAARTEAATA